MTPQFYKNLGRQYGKSSLMAVTMSIRYGYFSREISRSMDDKAATWWRRLLG